MMTASAGDAVMPDVCVTLDLKKQNNNQKTTFTHSIHNQ
jgi:hypothetical protein